MYGVDVVNIGVGCVMVCGFYFCECGDFRFVVGVIVLCYGGMVFEDVDMCCVFFVVYVLGDWFFVVSRCCVVCYGCEC